MTTLPGDASALHEDFGEGAPEPGTPAAKAIEGRSLTQIAWTRLKRDKVAMTAGGIVLFMACWVCSPRSSLRTWAAASACRTPP